MADATVIALGLGAAAAAALLVRLAYWYGGRAAYTILGVAFALLAVLNLSVEAFSDAGRVASGGAIGFLVGVVAGLARYGMPRLGGPGSRDPVL